MFTVHLIKCHALCLLLRVDIHKPSGSLQEFILKGRHLRDSGASTGDEVLSKHQGLNSFPSVHIQVSAEVCLQSQN